VSKPQKKDNQRRDAYEDKTFDGLDFIKLIIALKIAGNQVTGEDPDHADQKIDKGNLAGLIPRKPPQDALRHVQIYNSAD
jgi:hypothetical protein